MHLKYKEKVHVGDGHNIQVHATRLFKTNIKGLTEK